MSAMSTGGLDGARVAHVPVLRPFRLKVEIRPNPYIGTLGVFLGAGISALSGRLVDHGLPDLVVRLASATMRPRGSRPLIT